MMNTIDFSEHKSAIYMEQHNIMKEFTATHREFSTLQSVISKELTDECKAAKISWLSWKLFFSVYSFLVSLITLFILTFLLAPLVWQHIKSLVIPQNNFNTIPISILAVFILWLILYGCLKYLFQQITSKKLFGILEYVMLVPLTTMMVDEILHFSLGDFTLFSNLSQYLSGISTLFYSTPILLTALLVISIFTLVSLMPTGMILLIETSLRDDFIINRVIERKYIHIQHWSDSLAQKVMAHNKRKSVNLPAQVQIATPALGALGLLSLLALFFKQEEFQDIVKSVNSLLGRLSSGTVDLNILIIVVITLLVVGSIVYIFQAFWQLRVSEIVDTLCLIRIEECEREKKEIEERSSSRKSLSHSQTYTGMLLNYLRQFSFKSSHYKGKY
jgi:hypothetical protein